jgi:hypothetical protein
MVDGFTAIAKDNSSSNLKFKINSSALLSSLHEHHQPQQRRQQQPTSNKSINTSINKMSASSLSVSSSAALPLPLTEENENKNVTSPKIVISDSKRILQRRKRSWVEKSHKYYTTVMRNNNRRARGQIQRHNRHRRENISTTTRSTSTKNNSINNNDKDNGNDEYEISALLIAHRRKDFYISQQFYFAWKQIKLGKLTHAEQIYRKLIYELKAQMMEEGDECTIMDYDLSSVSDESSGGQGLRTCDNSQLATTTLLLCLLLQRTNQVKATRAAFLEFFRIIRVQVQIDNENTGAGAGTDTGTGAINCKDVNVQERYIVECTCSAKVLQAYALFEMKQGHVKKSYELVRLAVRMDKELEPVLSWKQFRDAKALVG